MWIYNEICLLFGRDKSVISRHIRNIFKDGELEQDQTVAKNATVQKEGDKTVRRTIEFYNLDVIISVGYRVKSQNGIIFRKWANSVLKEYLLRGYVVDANRALITNENYVNLINKVESIDARLTKIEEKHIPDLEKVFFDGEYLDARVFIKGLFSKAATSIVVIDPYADAKALGFLSSKDNAIPATIIVSSKAKLTQDDVEAFSLQYGLLTVKSDDSFHDRFIVMDGRSLYHLGASLNYAGRKTFAISELTEQRLTKGVIDRINAI